MTDPHAADPNPDAAGGSPHANGAPHADDPAFLARVDQFLNPADAVTMAEHDADAAAVAALERDLAADPAKRRAFVLACLGEAIVHEELAIETLSADVHSVAAELASADDRAISDGSAEAADEPTSPDEADVAAAIGASIPDGPFSLHDAMVLPAMREEAGGRDEPADPPSLRSAPYTPRPTARLGRGRRSGAWALAAVAAAAASVVVAVQLFRPPPVVPLAHRATPPAATTTSAPATDPAVVAVVADAAVGATWSDGTPAEPGAVLRAGADVTLVAGTALLRMGPGPSGVGATTEVVVEAPAKLRLDSPRALTLAYGKVAVRMPDGDAGFVVRTATAAVTDLGTEFGVSVDPAVPDPAEADTDVHVFRGRVRVAAATADPAVREVAAGDAAKVTPAGGVAVAASGVRPQLFVRSLGGVAAGRLSLVDLVSGGDGTTGRRDGVIDPLTGASGTVATLPPAATLNGAGTYRRVPGLPVVDGCFVPKADGRGPTTVDSLGRAVALAGCRGLTTTRLSAGGRIPRLLNGNVIYTQLSGVDYADDGHGFLFMHPDLGVTFDLAAVRRLHPGARLARFRCAVGNTMGPAGNAASAVVLVDGVERFARRGFLPADGAAAVDVLLADADRMLTLVTTGDGNPMTDQILFGDPVLEVAPARAAAPAGR